MPRLQWNSAFSNTLRRTYSGVKTMMGNLSAQSTGLRRQVKCARTWLGNKGARWCVCPEGLSASSVVYSFGVGEDISFDLELIRRFHVQVHAFDPTPRSIEWVKRQTLPECFVFHPYGIADFSGIARFHPPANVAHVSHTLIDRGTVQSIEVPVYRLCKIMEILGHQRIDLLKMDIEGAEYGVVSELISSTIKVEQLLIEFHHRWPEIGLKKTKQAVRALNTAGYQIFDVSPNREEFSFIGRGRVPSTCP